MKTNLPAAVPWFMFDLTNYQLITSKIVPGDIRDSKQIILTEAPIPGLNYQPVFPGGAGNRKLAFTLPLVQRNGATGNVLLLKQFEMLRNQPLGFRSIVKTKFSPMPKVLYYWGVGSLPLVYWVSKMDATHKQGWINQFGLPMYSELEIELILDESDSLLNKAEELFRQVSAYLGEAQELYSLTQGRPY